MKQSGNEFEFRKEINGCLFSIIRKINSVLEQRTLSEL